MRKILSSKLSLVLFVVLVLLISRIGLYIPDGLQSIDLFFFQIENQVYPDLSVFYWALKMKLIIVLICLYWYLTTSHWWRIFIWIPIIIELFKIREAVDLTENYMDNTNYIDSLPFTLPLLILLCFVFWKEFNYAKSKILFRRLDIEIEELLNEESESAEIISIQNDFTILKRDRNSLSREEYVLQLKALQNKLLRIGYDYTNSL